MAYVITEPCIDTKDGACTVACPVDCIYEGGRMFYIQPEECINCRRFAFLFARSTPSCGTRKCRESACSCVMSIVISLLTASPDGSAPGGWDQSHVTSLDHPFVADYRSQTKNRI